MTHKELLEKINYEIDLELRGMDAESWHAKARALRAVMELHKPFDFTMGGEPYLGCNCGQEYPCPTILAIEKELK